MDLHGTINHIAITVSDLDKAMEFLGPFLEFFGYKIGAKTPYNETFLTVNVNDQNGISINVWEAKKTHRFEVYEPGLHHIALNAGSKNQVDQVKDLSISLGAKILDGPGEFPFAEHGYYAVYFIGPDNMKFEVVYMPELEHLNKSSEQSAA